MSECEKCKELEKENKSLRLILISHGEICDENARLRKELSKYSNNFNGMTLSEVIKEIKSFDSKQV